MCLCEEADKEWHKSQSECTDSTVCVLHHYLLKLELDRFGVGCSHCLSDLVANPEGLLFGGSLQQNKHAAKEEDRQRVRASDPHVQRLKSFIWVKYKKKH